MILSVIPSSGASFTYAWLAGPFPHTHSISLLYSAISHMVGVYVYDLMSCHEQYLLYRYKAIL